MSRHMAPSIRAARNETLTEDQLRHYVPSVFADAPHDSRSDRYAYIPSVAVMRGLAGEGFLPVAAAQSRTKDDTRRDFTKHMVRFRHQDATMKAVADRFGISTKTVRQRLALGALDDTILDAWRDGKIKEDAAQAFTLTGDKKLQAKTFKVLEKTTWNGRVSPDDVKEALNVNPNDVGKLLNTVGVEAYEARGGKVTRDLFGDDHTVSDEALLKTMIEETVAATCQRLLGEGWSWATSEVPNNSYEYGHLQGQMKPTPEEKAKIEKLEAISNDETLDYDATEAADDELGEIKAAINLRSFTAKQKATAGCFVKVDQHGRLAIDYGRTAPAKVKVNVTETIDEETGETIKQTTLGKKKIAGAKKGPATLTKALIDRLDEQREKAIKAALVAHPHKDGLSTLIAGIAAGLIRAGSWNSAPFDDRYPAIMDAIDPKVMNAALRKAFDGKGYFESCGKAFCAAALNEAVNADEARKASTMKKAELAKFAFKNVGDTGWLPKELRTSHYDGPRAKAKSKAKSAAKAKKK
jgi:ParB family chromosome partitioning protein